MKKSLFTLATLLWIGAGPNVAAQTPSAPAFDVASVKPSNPNPDPTNPLGSIALMLPQPGGRLRGTNMPLRMLIMAAYELKQDTQLSGGPPALLSAKYDITAQAAGGTLVMKELPQLLRSLLADRFKLKAHTESRELPLYDLVLAHSDGRLGPELKPSQSDCSKVDQVAAEQGAALAKGDVGSFVGKPRPCSVSTDPSGGPLNLLMRGDGQEMKSLAEVLAVHRPRGSRQERAGWPLRLRHEARSADGARARPEDGRQRPGGRREHPTGRGLVADDHAQRAARAEARVDSRSDGRGDHRQRRGTRA
jgi:uncharacterized protein (TIGR03435 family)